MRRSAMRVSGRDLATFLSPIAVQTSRSRTNTRRCLCRSAVHAADTRVRLATFRHTEALGRLLGKSLAPGAVVLLHGELGSGKTSFARGFVQAALDDPSVAVTSPTFLLANEYVVPSDAGEEEFKIFHVDLWRVKDSSSRPIVDFENVFQNHVALIEWPDRLGAMTPDRRLDVFLDYVDVPVTKDNPWGFADHDVLPGDGSEATADGRVVTLRPQSEFWERKLQSIEKDLQQLDDGKITDQLLS